MSVSDEQLEGRGGVVAAGAALALVGLAFFGAALAQLGGLAAAIGAWLAGGLGWGAAIDALLALELLRAGPAAAPPADAWRLLLPGFLLLAAGLVVLGSGLRRGGPVVRPLGPAPGRRSTPLCGARATSTGGPWARMAKASSSPS